MDGLAETVKTRLAVGVEGSAVVGGRSARPAKEGVLAATVRRTVKRGAVSGNATAHWYHCALLNAVTVESRRERKRTSYSSVKGMTRRSP